MSARITRAPSATKRRTVAAPLVSIASIGTQLTEAFAGLDRIREILDMPTESDEDARRAEVDRLAGDVAFEEDVRRALQEVPEEHRAVLVLHDVHDLDFDEIAAVLDIPSGTAKSRLHRGRLALARALGEPSARREASNP